MIAHLNNTDIAYDVQGEGIPVLFLHAFPLNRTMWQPQVEALENQYQIITVDYRCFGESEVVDEPLEMDLLADDILALARHLSIDSFVLTGLSMGGYVAFAFYRRYPHLVKAMILADTRAERDTKQAQAKRKKMAQQAIRKGSAYIAEEVAPDLLGDYTKEYNAGLVQQVIDMIAGNDVKAIANAQLGMATRRDSKATLRSITRPTLLLVGEEDSLTPANLAEKMKRYIRNSELVVIPNAGHISNLENPDAFNTAVKHFLKTI